MKMIKNNTGSPFQLQRSMVPQGDENGAYSQGGYNPDAVAYNGEVMNSVIESSGATLGAALTAMGSQDQSGRMQKRKDRLAIKKQKLESKAKAESTSAEKKARLGNRIERVGGRLDKATSSLNTYNESKKPKLTSTIENKYETKKPEVKEEVKEVEKKETEGSTDSNTFWFNPNYYLKNKYKK
jgi:hypothetical protein